MSIAERAGRVIEGVVQGGRTDGFRINAQDFLSVRELGKAVTTPDRAAHRQPRERGGNGEPQLPPSATRRGISRTCSPRW